MKKLETPKRVTLTDGRTFLARYESPEIRIATECYIEKI